MALVNVVNMVVLDNPAPFLNPFQFEITFECLQELQDDLEWKVLYVGSPDDSSYDQILDESLVGPVPVGLNKFVLQADPPDAKRLTELLGVTVVLVTCSYRDCEFVRVGYYVNNELTEDEAERIRKMQEEQLQIQQQFSPEEKKDAAGESTADPDGKDMEQDDGKPVLIPPPPEKININKVQRHILADKPRVTRFNITWDDNNDENTAGNGTGMPSAENSQQNSHPAMQFMVDNGGGGDSTIGNTNATSSNQFA